MDSNQFDLLTKRLATGMTRRSVIAGATAASALTLAKGGSSLAQDATPVVPADDSENGQAFLFVQTFTGGTFADNPSAGTPVAAGTPEAGMHGTYLLTLGGHPGQTVYFSDRPERIVGDVPTDTLVEGLGFSPDNPPNAALATENADGQTITAVLEIMNPVVDLSAGTVTYEVELLDEYTDEGLQHLVEHRDAEEIPAEFGAASLYIDDCPSASLVCYEKGSTCPGGEIATGNIGQCWNWTSFLCDFCKPCDQWCDEKFASCNENCDCTLSSNYCK